MTENNSDKEEQKYIHPLAAGTPLEGYIRYGNPRFLIAFAGYVIAIMSIFVVVAISFLSSVPVTTKAIMPKIIFAGAAWAVGALFDLRVKGAMQVMIIVGILSLLYFNFG